MLEEMEGARMKAKKRRYLRVVYGLWKMHSKQVLLKRNSESIWSFVNYKFFGILFSNTALQPALWDF